MTLNVCNYVVLDEADRMIDAGFEAQILAVMDEMPSSNLRPEGEEGLLIDEAAAAAEASQMMRTDEEEHESGSSSKRRYRQTVMFSATMPPRVEALAKKYLRHAVFVAVGDRQKGASKVEQRVEWLTSEGQKKSRLIDLVQQSERPLIIFSNLKKTVDSICKWLSNLGIGSVALHGGKSQDDRMAALAAFKAAEVPVLVATDVAGRGLDVQGVKHVIQYDLPSNDVRITPTHIHTTQRIQYARLMLPERVLPPCPDRRRSQSFVCCCCLFVVCFFSGWRWHREIHSSYRSYGSRRSERFGHFVLHGGRRENLLRPRPDAATQQPIGATATRCTRCSEIQTGNHPRGRRGTKQTQDSVQQPMKRSSVRFAFLLVSRSRPSSYYLFAVRISLCVTGVRCIFASRRSSGEKGGRAHR
jgi:hypothetical protein